MRYIFSYFSVFLSFFCDSGVFFLAACFGLLFDISARWRPSGIPAFYSYPRAFLLGRGILRILFFVFFFVFLMIFVVFLCCFVLLLFRIFLRSFLRFARQNPYTLLLFLGYFLTLWGIFRVFLQILLAFHAGIFQYFFHFVWPCEVLESPALQQIPLIPVPSGPHRL